MRGWDMLPAIQSAATASETSGNWHLGWNTLYVKKNLKTGPFRSMEKSPNDPLPANDAKTTDLQVNLFWHVIGLSDVD